MSRVSLGWKGIMLTAWIGTPVHESGHLLMCYIFRHKVKGFKLFDRKARDGVLGYVNHSWNRKSLYQNIGNFFIGMGPIFSGTAALILGMHFFLPDSFAAFTNYLTLDPDQPNQYILTQIFTLTAELFTSIFSAENLTSISFWIYFILAISISSHIALSKEDLKGARKRSGHNIHFHFAGKYGSSDPKRRYIRFFHEYSCFKRLFAGIFNGFDCFFFNQAGFKRFCLLRGLKVIKSFNDLFTINFLFVQNPFSFPVIFSISILITQSLLTFHSSNSNGPFFP